MRRRQVHRPRGLTTRPLRRGAKRRRLERRVRRLVDHYGSGYEVVKRTLLPVGKQHQELAPCPGGLEMLNGLKPRWPEWHQGVAPVAPERVVLGISDLERG